MKQKIDITELDISFNTLYVNLPYTNVTSFDDCIIFRNIPIGYVSKTVDEINDKINELKLPLIAKSNASNGIFNDSILVTPKLLT